MKKRITYSPEQYRTFANLRHVLLRYAKGMDIEADQQESFYIVYADKQIYGRKAGTMFAALQIMTYSVDLYLPVLMQAPKTVPAHLLKDIAGALDDKGVLHILKCPPGFLKSVELLIRFAAFTFHNSKQKVAAL